jgi:sphinganine-1-phosphate aldolase
MCQAPSFAHGVVDDIEGLSALALAHGIGLHVDNCLGGFLLSFLSSQRLFDKPWDFALAGVTSISVDVHKYGFATKGSSVVCYRDDALRRTTYIPSSDGCEGLYVTPTLQGSRGGGVMAAAWATLVHMGEDGYAKAARTIHETHGRVKECVKQTRGLRLATDADLAVVPICGDGLDVYALATLLEKRGWNFFTGQKPAALSIAIGDQTIDHLDTLLADLKECTAYLLKNPKTKADGMAAVYGSAAALPDEVLEGVLRGYVDIKMRVKPAAGASKAAGASAHAANGSASKRPSRRSRSP